MAEKDENQGQNAKKKKKKKKGNTLKTLVLSILAFGLAILLQMSFVLLLIGLLPSVLAHLVDNSTNRSKFHTVFAFNLSGCIPFLAELINEDNNKAAIKEMIADPQTLISIYMSAGFGYAVVAASSVVAAWLVNTLNSRKSGHIISIQDQLVEEWGKEIQQTDLDTKV